MGTIKKTMALALSLAMAVTAVPTANLNVKAAEKKAAGQYVIYPTPHHVTYNEESFSLKDAFNVVYDEGIDDYTKRRVEDAAAVLGKEVTVGTEVDAGKTNILVGIEGSEGTVDQYFDNIEISDDALFEHHDAYALNIDDNVIAVLGEDTDAAFAGITTVKHIFNQVEDNTVSELMMEDYADVKARGFIEGYYGNPWSVEDRIDLMKFGGEYKMNTYIYAPKDDPKHNSAWRELYTEEELVDISRLAEAGNESKCYYVYALHPFMNNPINFNNYEADLNVIKTKFEQVMTAGGKQFAILADDARAVAVSDYVRLMTDLTNWLKEKQDEYPGLKAEMVFVPENYTGYGDSAQLQGLKALPETVSIVETGGGVWGNVSPAYNDRFYSNMGRPAYMWINWPCSDNTKDGLIMGGAEKVLKPGTKPHTVDGIVLNPMQQSEASKEGIFTNADYAWNIWEDASEYDKVWEVSFNYMDHGTYEDTEASAALREISKHMMNSQQLNNEESVALQPKMAAFLSDLQNGRDIKAGAEELIREFTLLKESAAAYKANPGNEKTRDQMIYWLDCWEDTANAVIGYLNTAIALQEEEAVSDIWNLYAKAQQSFDKSTKHALWYMDHYEYAKVGRRYIYPFMLNLDVTLSAAVIPLVNPGSDEIKVISNRGDQPSYAAENMIDGDEGTFAQWRSPNSSAAGDYFGVMYGQAFTLNSVKFLMSDYSYTNKNTFKTAILQYTEDGKVWKDIEGSERGNKAYELSADGLDVEVKGIRVKCTEDTPDIWPSVREIYVNGKPITEPKTGYYSASVIKSSDYSVYQTYSESRLLDNDDNSYVWYKNEGGSKVGDYIGLDLGEVKPIGLTRIVMGHDGGDYWREFDLEYSVDGTNYTVFQHLNQAVDQKVFEIDMTGVNARYIRVKNTLAKNVWLKFSGFNVYPGAENHAYTNSEELKELPVAISDTEATLNCTEEITLKPGEYVGIELPFIKFVDGVNVDLTNGEALKCQVSVNEADWQDAAAAETEIRARYARLFNDTEENVTFTINAFVLSIVDDGRDARFETNAEAADGCPEKFMFDKDLKSFYTAATEEAGYVTYILSDNLGVKKMNIFQNEEGTGARVYVLTDGAEGKEWQLAGTLNGLLTTINTASWKNIYQVKVEWDAGKVPEINEIILFTASEAEDPNPVYTVTVNGEAAATGVYNTKVTVTAPAAEEGMKFAGWKADGKVVSTEETYTFYLSGDLALTTEYVDVAEEVAAEARAFMTNAFAMRRAEDNKSDLRYVGQLVVPEGCTLKNAGLVWSSNKETALTAEGALNPAAKATYIKAISTSNQFSVTIKGVPTGRFVRGMIFAELEDAEGNTIYVFSEEKRVNAF